MAEDKKEIRIFPNNEEFDIFCFSFLFSIHLIWIEVSVRTFRPIFRKQKFFSFCKTLLIIQLRRFGLNNLKTTNNLTGLALCFVPTV